MKRGTLLFVLGVCLLSTILGCGKKTTPEEAQPKGNPFALDLPPISAHDRMIVALRSYRKQQEADPYLGDGALKIAQAML
ncbi:MAG: hypothetical protein ABGX07_23250, partial [Pirellulaceae bacterium]